jgi:hypothetical protein
MLFELRVGAGRLFVCAIDLLDAALERSPEAAQLLTSLERYVGSPRFQPTTAVTPEALKELLGP